MSGHDPKLVRMRRAEDGRESFVSEDRAEILRLKERDGFREVRTHGGEHSKLSERDARDAREALRRGRQSRGGF